MHSSSRKGFIILVAIPFIIAGLLLVARGANKFYLYFASSSWPTVKAEILDAKLVQIEDKSRGGSTTGLHGSFSYEYNNQRYTSEHIDISGGYNTNVEDKKSKLAILLEAKTKGQKLEAYVNPAEPSFAFIFREISSDMFSYFLVGAISFFMGKWLGKFSRFWPWQPASATTNTNKGS